MKNALVKFLTAVVCLSMVTTNLPAAGFWGHAEISIPSRLGYITERYAAPTTTSRAPHIYLIQDLHANLSAQRRIADILKRLHRRAGLSTIFTEAAFDWCDVSAFRTFAGRAAQKAFLQDQLEKGYLTGGELAAIEEGHGALSPIRLIGVDDPVQYVANVEAYQSLDGVRQSALNELRQAKDAMRDGASPALKSHFDLLQKLLRLRINTDEWETYERQRQWTPVLGKSFIRALGIAERFYQAASARHIALASNLLNQIEFDAASAAPLKPVALVTGGFHTRAIGKILKINGISYTVITPAISELDQDYRYHKMMMESISHSAVMGRLTSGLRDRAALSEIEQTPVSAWYKSPLKIFSQAGRVQRAESKQPKAQTDGLAILARSAAVLFIVAALPFVGHSLTPGSLLLLAVKLVPSLILFGIALIFVGASILRLGTFSGRLSTHKVVARVTALSAQPGNPNGGHGGEEERRMAVERSQKQTALIQRATQAKTILKEDWNTLLARLEARASESGSVGPVISVNDLENLITFQREVAFGLRIDAEIPTLGASFAKTMGMSFYHASDLALRTVQLLEQDLAHENDTYRRERLIRDMNEFRKFGQYSMHAGHAVMYARDILKQVDGYYLLSNHEIERSGLGRKTRRAFGIEKRVWQDRQMLEPELKVALHLGDELSSHFYNGNSGKILNDFLAGVSIDALTAPDPINQHENDFLDILRKIATRLISIVGLTYSGTLMLNSLIHGQAIPSTSIYGILLALSVWGLHRAANWVARLDFRYKRLHSEWEAASIRIQTVARHENPAIRLEDSFEALERSVAERALANHLNAAAAPELILIVVDKQNPLLTDGDVDALRSTLIGPRAFVHLVEYDGKGSLNALAHAYSRIPELRQTMTGFETAPINIGVLMAGGANQSVMTQTDEPTSRLLWQSQYMNLLAGLEMLRQAKTQNRMVVIGADNDYVGGWHGFENQLNENVDWAFGASMMSLRQGQETDVAIVQTDIKGRPLQIYEPALAKKVAAQRQVGLQPPKEFIPNGVVDPANSEVAQVKGLNDTHLFRLDSERVQTFFDGILHYSQPTSLTHDALVAAVRGENGSSQDSLLGMTLGLSDLELSIQNGEASNDLQKLIREQQKAKAMSRLARGLQVRAVIPSRSRSTKIRATPTALPTPQANKTKPEVVADHSAVHANPVAARRSSRAMMALGVGVAVLLIGFAVMYWGGPGDLSHFLPDIDSHLMSASHAVVTQTTASLPQSLPLPEVAQSAVQQGASTAVQHVLSISAKDVHGLGDAILRVIHDGSDPELAQALKGSLWGQHGSVARVWSVIAEQAHALDVSNHATLAKEGITRMAERSVDHVLVGDHFTIDLEALKQGAAAVTKTAAQAASSAPVQLDHATLIKTFSTGLAPSAPGSLSKIPFIVGASLIVLMRALFRGTGLTIGATLVGMSINHLNTRIHATAA